MSEPTTLPPGYRIVHAPDVVSGAPPLGSMWAVNDESGAATSPAWSEAETIARAHALQARLDRMLEAMQRRRAA